MFSRFFSAYHSVMNRSPYRSTFFVVVVLFCRQLLVPGGNQWHLSPLFFHDHCMQTNGFAYHPSNLKGKFAALHCFLYSICLWHEFNRLFPANGKHHRQFQATTRGLDVLLYPSSDTQGREKIVWLSSRTSVNRSQDAWLECVRVIFLKKYIFLKEILP